MLGRTCRVAFLATRRTGQDRKGYLIVLSCAWTDQAVSHPAPSKFPLRMRLACYTGRPFSFLVLPVPEQVPEHVQANYVDKNVQLMQQETKRTSRQ